MQKFDKMTATAAPLPITNVDTDMIIPKQFLKTIKRTGLGVSLFSEMRYDSEGRENPDFVLNKPAYREAKILVAGENFGCGSSREHAPWALVDFGFRVVVARSFADIFAQNAVKNGLLTVALDDASHARVVEALRADPAASLHVDLRGQTLSIGDASFAFPADAFAKRCLLEGIDELGYILSFSDRITEHEQRSH